MYKLGRPARRRRKYLKILAMILVIAGLTFGVYSLITRSSAKSVIKNNPTPLVTNVDPANNNSRVDETLFTMTLPGHWQRKEGGDAKYHYIQWSYTGKESVGRLVKVYIDTIPVTQAVNYLLPVAGIDNYLQTGQQSENCVTFTDNATNSTNKDVATPQNKATIPSRWQQVSFLCDNSHVSHQVVGTGSAEGVNTVSVTGKNFGRHQYFFVYQDDNARADYSIFVNILNSFRAK